jgi:hypothetical protein
MALSACGGSAGPANSDAAGDAAAGSGGGASAGTGGASAGTGGASAGSGGASAGTGGASAGTGGASAGSGGASGGGGGSAGAGAAGSGASDEVHAPFVAVGEAAGRAFSADGKSWTKAADPTTLPSGWTGPPAAGDNQWLFRGGCYGAGKYLAVGGTGGDQGLMMISADGKAWSLVGGAQANDDCAYGLGRWVTSKRYSLDGATWTVISSPISSRQMVFGSGLFVSVTDIGTGAVEYSGDGLSWNKLPITYVGTDTNRLGYDMLTRGGGRFIAANSVRSDSPIFEWDGVSAQSFTETPRATLLGSNVAITALAYGRGKFVIATSGALFQRPAAGGTWTKTSYTGTGQLRELVVTPDLYVTPNAWSADGVTWTPSTNPPSATRIIATGP